MAAALALACLPGCGRDAASRPLVVSQPPLPRATRGYVLISIDTLRADHLGCYGYPRPTSPFLDELARRATLFEEAYAQYPSTLVSHMSMFTGLYPREHGVLPPSSVLSPRVETLPEVFQRQGFRTAGFTEGGFVSGRFGFRRGFDVFVSHERNRDRPVASTFRRGIDFVASLAPRDRFFLFLHTYAVHTPYDAPERYQRLFRAADPPEDAIPASGPSLIRQSMTGERPRQEVIDWLEARYDAGIRQTDDVLRHFFAELVRLGLADQVTVAITADHGEEFMEHGLFNHTQLYRETLHVPLLVVHPDQRSAARQGGVVQLVDLAPTFYELARVRPGGRPSGASLARRLGLASSPPSLAATAWSEAPDGMRAVYRGEHRDLESLLLFDPPAETWFPRRVAFDAPGGMLAFEARSFEQRRRLSIRRGREPAVTASLTPEWTPIRVALAGPERVVLEADGCAVPDEDTKREPRCYAFQVRGRRLTRIELYDVARDPRQVRNLFGERRDAARGLLGDLLAFHPRPVAPAATAPLDPGLEKSLRALGYLK